MQTLDVVRWPWDPRPRGQSVVESVPTLTLNKVSVTGGVSCVERIVQIAEVVEISTISTWARATGNERT
jgi:hypothetical protein